MKVVLFSQEEAHKDFALFLAQELGSSLVIKEDPSCFDKKDLNLLPDYLISEKIDPQQFHIIQTKENINYPFKNLIGNLESSPKEDYFLYLYNLNRNIEQENQMILTKSTDKQLVKKYFEDFFISEKFNKQIASQILQTIDELLMNAIFDAPGLNISRSSKFPLSKPVYLYWTKKDNIFSFSVKDQWGSLDKDRVLSRLGQDLSNYQIDETYHGAGLGLLQSYSLSGANIKFVCIPKEETTVSCIFSLKKKNKDFKQQLKFISFK